MRSVVVVPTYNECDNVDPFLRAVRRAAPDSDILLVDDDSPDGTGRLADELAAELGQIDVLHRPGKEGLGSAYRHGFRVVLAAEYDIVVSMDVDFSHEPSVIPELIAAVEGGADLAIGSRYVDGGGTVDWPLHRRILSRWGNRYTGAVIGVGVRDCTSGFRAYRASSLASIEPDSTTAEGYAFLTELVRRLSRRGSVVVEVPITFRDRERGTSKMSWRIIAESMLLVTRWGIQDRVSALRSRRRAR